MIYWRAHSFYPALLSDFLQPGMVNNSGTGNAKVTVFLTPEEVDRAVKTNVDFGLPGQ